MGLSGVMLARTLMIHGEGYPFEHSMASLSGLSPLSGLIKGLLESKVVCFLLTSASVSQTTITAIDLYLIDSVIF